MSALVPGQWYIETEPWLANPSSTWALYLKVVQVDEHTVLVQDLWGERRVVNRRATNIPRTWMPNGWRATPPKVRKSVTHQTGRTPCVGAGNMHYS
jgi:hypothetical protein